MGDGFVPEGFVVPQGLAGVGFRLEPLGPAHNERDHRPWTTSIQHIHDTPGFPDGSWPRPMSLEDNLADLERHADDFERRAGFTYSVLDGDEVIGCVYIYPSTQADHDAAVASWVRASRAEMDAPLASAVSEWLQRDWPFTDVEHAPRD